MNTLTSALLVWFALPASFSPLTFSAETAISQALNPPSTTSLKSHQAIEQLRQESNPESEANKAESKPSPFVVNQNETDPDSRPHDNQATPKKDGPASNWLDPITIFTGVLTIVAVLQVFLMRHQSGIMRDEMEATRIAAVAAKESVEQMRLDQRPWLGAISATIQTMKVGEPLAWDVTITNTGKTPGRIYEQFNWGIMVTPQIGEFGPEHAPLLDEHVESTIEKQPLDKTATVVMPGATIFFRNGAQSEPLDAAKIQGIRNGITRFFVVQLFSFTDIATQTNYERLRFNFIYSRVHDGFVTYGDRYTIK